MEFGSGSSSNSLSSSSSDSLNGLKFGGKIYFENANGPVGSSSASRLVKPPPAPAKKGKVRLGPFGQPPLCQVEGCNVDLSDAKAYYSRHKVCATHSKSPTAIVAGFEQRFCQQCSRFHLIPQFDQGKRSCRKRLANHNERRRKPSPGSLFSARHGTLSSQFLESSGRTGSFMLDFSNCSDVSGMDSGPNANMRHCGPENSPTEIDFQGSTARASYSDCTRALSLLSTQPRGSSDESSSFGIHGFVDVNGVPVVQSSGSIDSFSSSLYDLKGSECNGGSIERMLPDLGLGGVVLQPDGSQYYEDDLEVVGQYNERGHYVLELEDRRGYDSSSLQNMNWFS